MPYHEDLDDECSIVKKIKMSGLPSSHANGALTYQPIITGSIVYALLTMVGLALVFGARSAGKLESKEVGMSLVFVTTAGVCMWLVYISAWMVSCFFFPLSLWYSVSDPQPQLRKS